MEGVDHIPANIFSRSKYIFFLIKTQFLKRIWNFPCNGSPFVIRGGEIFSHIVFSVCYATTLDPWYKMMTSSIFTELFLLYYAGFYISFTWITLQLVQRSASLVLWE